jgi:HEPN domain-containing protein
VNAPREQALALRAAAERDLKSLGVLLRAGPEAPHATCGFLAQQACEKLLKCALLWHETRFERTHDLQWLATRAATAGLVAPVEAVQLAALNPYAVDMRYEASDVIWVSEDDIRLWTKLMQEWVDRMIDGAGDSMASRSPWGHDPT